jgi:hypothetical protein
MRQPQQFWTRKSIARQAKTHIGHWITEYRYTTGAHPSRMSNASIVIRTGWIPLHGKLILSSLHGEDHSLSPVKMSPHDSISTNNIKFDDRLTYYPKDRNCGRHCARPPRRVKKASYGVQEGFPQGSLSIVHAEATPDTDDEPYANAV